MAHSIAGVVVRGSVSLEQAAAFDTAVVGLPQGYSLVWLDIHHSEAWQKRLGLEGTLAVPAELGARDLAGMLPTERAVLEVVRRLSSRRPVEFVVLVTEYFGGVGSQLAVAFREEKAFPTDGGINAALQAIGAVAAPGLDAFDTLGLGAYRSLPDEVLARWASYDD